MLGTLPEKAVRGPRRHRLRDREGGAGADAHRYQCRGDDAHVAAGLCIGIGGVRVDCAVATQILEAVSDRAIEAAILAADQVAKAAADVRQAVDRELEEARYEASLVVIEAGHSAI